MVVWELCYRQAGMKMGETPEMLNNHTARALISIHEKYLNAVQILYMPTHLAETDISLRSADIQLMSL